MPDFRAKMHQKSISAVAPPIDPAEGAYSAPPDLLAGFGGHTSKGRGGRKGKEGKGRGKKGREGEVRGRKGGKSRGEKKRGGKGKEGGKGRTTAIPNFFWPCAI